MRISIRRCLSMLRNTSDGNELAMPLPMPLVKEHSVGGWNTVYVGFRDRCILLTGASAVELDMVKSTLHGVEGWQRCVNRYSSSRCTAHVLLLL